MHAQPVGTWKEQPIEVPVRGLMGISMADTGTGYAVGDVDVILQQTGILLKKPGDPTWRTVPASAFSPPLTIALSSWAQDVHAVPNTGIAYISWRDDYRSLVYKTVNYGASWFSVSPLNPILYGIRYAITFINDREGMIVGEGPGRVHRTLDGGVSWTSYTIPVNPPLTDAKYSGSYWFVSGGENSLFRYSTLTNRWFNLSFTHSTEYFPTHIKLHFINDQYGYLNGYNQNTPSHLMKTSNSGIDWNPVPNQPPFGSIPDGHKGLFFFDTLKGWVASAYDELAYTEDGGYSWFSFQPQVFGGKPYPPVNKMVFLNEAFGWAVGGVQRAEGYPSVSYGWIMKWTGTQKPDISTTPVAAAFDTMACQTDKLIKVPIYNTGTGSLTIAAGGITFSRPEFSLHNVTFPIIISPGGMHEVEVRWTPGANDYGLTPSGSRMIIESNDNDHTPWNVALYGNRFISRLVPKASSIVFPPFCSGESVEATLPVDMFGNLPPRILKIELFSDRGSLQLLSHIIGDAITGPDLLRFSLRSDRAGSLSGKIIITAGNPDCPEIIDIPFQALIQSNEIEVTPALIQFKDVCAGDDVVQYVQLRNVGSVPGQLREFRQYGADSVFTLEADTTLEIGNGDFRLLALRFNPRKADSLSSSSQFRLVFEPCADTVLIACSGRGVGAFIDLEADSLLVVGPAPLDREVITTVPLRNVGYLPTVIDEIRFEPAVPGLRLLEPTSLPDTLRPKSAIDVRFAYQASNRDSIKTTMHVRWADPCGGSIVQHILLISDEMPIAEVPASLVFATQTCEADVLDSVRISNTGQKPLAVFTTDITGSEAAHFRVVGPKLPITIDPGKSAWIYLAYNAPVNGSSSAALVINHNDLTVKGVSRVVLNGRKKVQMLTVVGDTLGVLSLCTGVPGSRRFVLRNDNPDVLLLSSVDLIQGSPFVTLRSGKIPTSVLPGESFELWADVTLPLDTTISIEIRVVTDPCRAVYVLRFRASVPVPLLTVVPDPLDLGILPVADTSLVAVRVRNSDSMDVVVDALLLRESTSAMYLAAQLPGPRTLRPGESLVADLKLRLAKDTGIYRGTLCAIVSSPCPDTICFEVQAHFVGTPFVFSADTLRYTFAYCDTLLCDTVRVVNALTGPQRVFPAVSNNAVFSVEPDTATLLEAGDGITYRICARKPVLAIARGELLLQSDAAPMTAVALIAVREDQDLLLPDTVDAGNIPFCESERVFTVPIENRSGLDEIVFDLSSSDGAFVPLSAMPRTIRAKTADSLTVRFRPAAAGVYSALLTMRSRTGGCERTTVIVLRGRAGEEYIEAMPSVLLFANVVAGTAQSKSVRILNRDMAGLRLAAIEVQPSAQFSASVALPMPLAPGATLDIPVVFLPDSAKNYFGSLCLIFDLPCPDTVCIPLEGIGVEGDLVFSLPRLRFDSLAFCEERIDTVLLRNTGSSTVLLKSASISGAGAAGFALLNPIAADEPLAAGAARELHLRFRAADVSDGVVTASLFISTDAPVQPVLELPLSGTRVSYIIPDEVILNLGQVLLGTVTPIVADFTNSGEAALTLSSFVAHGDYTLRTPTLPGVLYGGRTLRFEADLLPTREGALSDTLRFPAGPCGGELRIIVRGSALRRFVQNDLDFGDVPVCETRSGIVTMLNNGSSTVELSSIALTGSASAAFDIENLPALPHRLDPGAQLILTVNFQPSPGILGDYDALIVTTVQLDGSPVVFQSLLHATVRDGGLAFAAANMLGSGQLGTEYPGAIVTGRNTASFAVRVEEILLPSSQLRLLSAVPAPPVDIAAGDSMVIALAFIPDQLGMRQDSIRLRYSDPCATTLTVPLQYEGFGDLLPLDIVAGETSAAPDDTVDIPLLLTRDITGLNIRDWQVELGFNPSMLYPLAVVGSGTLSEGMQLAHDYNQSSGALTVSGSAGRLQGSGDVLAIVRCLVLIGDDSVTTLQPGAASFGHPAVRVNAYRPGRFTLQGYCLDDGSRLIGRSGGLLLAPPVPNPARSAVHLRYNLPRDGDFTLTVHDTQGRSVATVGEGRAAAGSHQASLDCATLPAGTYILVLRSAEGVVTERLTVVR